MRRSCGLLREAASPISLSGLGSLLSGKTVAATCSRHDGRGRERGRERERGLACAASRMIRTDTDSRARYWVHGTGVSLAHDLKS